MRERPFRVLPATSPQASVVLRPVACGKSCGWYQHDQMPSPRVASLVHRAKGGQGTSLSDESGAADLEGWQGVDRLRIHWSWCLVRAQPSCPGFTKVPTRGCRERRETPGRARVTSSMAEDRSSALFSGRLHRPFDLCEEQANADRFLEYRGGSAEPPGRPDDERHRVSTTVARPRIRPT